MPIAVALGVLLYSNAAGVLPIVYAVMEKGMSMCTVLTFMTAATVLPLPEMIIHRKVLKPRLLAVFAGIVTVTIIGDGYLFNIILYGSSMKKILVEWLCYDKAGQICGRCDDSVQAIKKSLKKCCQP